MAGGAGRCIYQVLSLAEASHFVIEEFYHASSTNRSIIVVGGLIHTYISCERWVFNAVYTHIYGWIVTDLK